MPGYPRLAVGCWGERSESGPVCWALAGCLERRGRRVRHFLAQACYGAPQGAVTTTGRASQYLDGWLSSTDVCRARLAEAYASADFVLAEGRYAPGRGSAGPRGGDLATLAERLDLPRIVVLEAALAADCRLPPRPDAVDGVILDGVLDAERYARMQICVEGAWGVPVVAGLERDEGLRQQIVCLPRGRTVAQELVDALIRRMDDYLQLDVLDAIAARPNLPQPTNAHRPPPQFVVQPTVALAFDDAFCGYFADVLERLEQFGVRFVDFSPLNDETLPDGVDAVFVGCGRPEEFADRLAANHCMRSALRNFARRGGVVYSEGGGTAYLSRTLVLDDGRTVPMVDALPLTAVVRPEREPWEPVEFTLGGCGRLGPPGTTVRGYRGGCYRFEPVEPCASPAVELPRDLFAAGNVVGGRMQLHLLEQPTLLSALFDRREKFYAVVG